MIWGIIIGIIVCVISYFINGYFDITELGYYAGLLFIITVLGMYASIFICDVQPDVLIKTTPVEYSQEQLNGLLCSNSKKIDILTKEKNQLKTITIKRDNIKYSVDIDKPKVYTYKDQFDTKFWNFMNWPISQTTWNELVLPVN